MNEQIQEQLLSILISLKDTASGIAGFLTEETPLVLKELLMWVLVKNFAIIFISLILMLPIVVWFYLAKKEYGRIDFKISSYDRRSGFFYDCDGDIKNIWTAFFIYSLFAIIIACCCIVPSVITILQVLIAPKIYLIEYVSTMVK